MKKTPQSPFVPYFAFDRAGGISLYQQVYSGVRAAILDGRLRPGQRLPSTRGLARELGISRLPVLTAFEQLLHEGYIVGRAGAGTFVTSSIMDRGDGASSDHRGPHRRERPQRSPADHPPPSRTDAPHPESLLAPFRVSLPALDRFPSKTWARLVSRHARRMSPAQMAYGDPAGYLPLREAIADYLRTARAVHCDADQVVIVSGSQMALRLCAMALLKPGDDACVEDPGYPGAWGALNATGATVRAVPVDAEGLRVRSIAIRKRVPRVIHVTPSHQYPLGMSMSASRRLELLEWARRHESWIVEDDYDSEYRFASRPLGALQGMDAASRVIYVGTFSKVMFPSLRLGYLVVPRPLVHGFIELRESLDIFSPTLYQLALSDFFSEGHFARHVRRMRTVYLARRDALVTGIQERLHQVLSIANADAGMHLTAWLRPGIDDREVVRRAAAHGISATPLSRCYLGRATRMGLVLGFGGADEREIERAVETLADVIRSMSTARRRREQAIDSLG
jgi:GntR family transcriptional regulator / MocR family aminotransferase